MAERKKTPNILADLLGDKPIASANSSNMAPQTVAPNTNAVPQSEALTNVNERTLPNIRADLPSSGQKALPSNQFAGKTSKRQNGRVLDDSPKFASQANEETANDEVGDDESPAKGKVKITFYLDETSVDQLEDAQLLLRKLARKSGKGLGKAATSKSALLEEALKLACLDLESHGENSQLVQNLVFSKAV